MSLPDSSVPASPGISLPQYSLGQLLGIWAAAALPMATLGWIANPALARPIDATMGIPGTARIVLLTLGLVWQFVLAMILLRREAGHLSWAVLRDRLWLHTPRDPRRGQPDKRLWLWLILLVPLFPLFVFVITPPLDKAWVALLPFLAEPSQYRFSQLIATPENRALLVGAWWLYGLFLTLALFNTFLGEELLFRGILLPRMRGVFAKWDWLANGAMFGAYHLHQPWGIPGSIVVGALLFALPTKWFRSAWFGIAIHSGQSVYFATILLPLVLGTK